MAIEMFCYRASQLISEMAASMQGFDTMVFTAGIGENSVDLLLAFPSAWVGLASRSTPSSTRSRSDEPRVISTSESEVRVLVVPTNEELMIALDVEALLG